MTSGFRLVADERGWHAGNHVSAIAIPDFSQTSTLS